MTLNCLLLTIACSYATAILTPLQEQQILHVFNEARSTTVVPAANMKMLAWDDTIAQEVQAYTDKCLLPFHQLDNPPAWFAYRDHARDPVGVAKWRTLRMAPYFDYNTGQCINTTKSHEICRHPDNYENIVFANNERVGCGMTVCGPGAKGVFHACAIGGAPVRNKLHPWIVGPRCSACPPGWGVCVNGLCSRSGTVASTPSPVRNG